MTRGPDPVRDCEHGRQRRKCEICEYESEIRDLRTELERERVTLWNIATWTHTMGKALHPPGADSYGEGMRDAKAQVARILVAKHAPR